MNKPNRETAVAILNSDYKNFTEEITNEFRIDIKSLCADEDGIRKLTQVRDKTVKECYKWLLRHPTCSIFFYVDFVTFEWVFIRGDKSRMKSKLQELTLEVIKAMANESPTYKRNTKDIPDEPIET